MILRTWIDCGTMVMRDLEDCMQLEVAISWESVSMEYGAQGMPHVSMRLRFGWSPPACLPTYPGCYFQNQGGQRVLRVGRGAWQAIKELHVILISAQFFLGGYFGYGRTIDKSPGFWKSLLSGAGSLPHVPPMETRPHPTHRVFGGVPCNTLIP